MSQWPDTELEWFGIGATPSKLKKKNKTKQNIGGQQQGTRDTDDGVTSCFYDEKEFIYKTDSI